MNGTQNMFTPRANFSPHPPWGHFAPPGFLPRNRAPQSWRAGSPTPPTNDHWCETCDRGFATAAILANHKGQHQKCNIDGCQFVAHPKVITKHIQMQHSSGLFKKIAKLNNPEEIQKWREERKKRFPTKANVEKKAAEIKEKIDRGEKMGLNHGKRRRDMQGPGQKRDQQDKFGKHKRPRHRQNYNKTNSAASNLSNVQMKNNDISNNGNKGNKNNNTENMKKTAPIDEQKGKLQPFSGIQFLLPEEIVSNDPQDTENNLIQDLDDDVALKIIDNSINETTEPVVCGALSALMCDYGTSDEDQDIKDTISFKPLIDNNMNKSVEQGKEPVEVVSEHDLETNSKKCDESNRVSDDDSGPEETKVIKGGITEAEKNNEITNSGVVKSKTKHVKKLLVARERFQNNPKKHKVPSTLIYKLLHKEIQHERNIILQCIRHIVKNNYFDK